MITPAVHHRVPMLRRPTLPNKMAAAQLTYRAEVLRTLTVNENAPHVNRLIETCAGG
ncbi:hypothetical protein FIBSPDRAFT_863312 [Athelia psychrophila]|uniref:Uncharacterized protein n=1 Tax=Athelia psychrophila TaxID=1759441 RepID=A0A166HKE9_9AGAM|nr:hypothetical protein FIBSPDRAFT_863312 [Fibularhizoctonia sp. CBS 109695]